MAITSEISTLEVSIHAPARGATFVAPGILLSRAFQFTLPRGERQVPPMYSTWWRMFQFTLPRGERQSALFQLAKSKGFNSRSREGSDRVHFFS